MRDEVRLYVRVSPERANVAVLRHAVDGFVDFLRASASGGWIVSDLRLGSITTAARPAPDNDIDVDAEFDRIVAGLDQLATTPTAPAGWTDEMLSGVAALKDITESHGVDSIELSFGDRPALPVTVETCRNAKEALENGPSAVGAVTGLVDRFYSRGGRHELGLVDESTNDTVTVRYRSAREADVRNLIGQRVTAWGVLRRTPGGRKRELRMDDFEIASPVSTLTVDDVKGILGNDWLDGRSSVEWVRGQRDD